MEPTAKHFRPQPRAALAPPLDVPLTVLPSHPCPYLPGRTATYRGLLVGSADPSVYRKFMDVGFRRSGHLLYQPVCERCRECVPLRVPVQTFQPGKSQRRNQRRNADIEVILGPPKSDDQKYALYQSYVRQWHRRDDAASDDSREAFESFLYDSPVDTVEFCYRSKEGRLLAVGICDIDPLSLSSVYFYFDPAQAARGLGTYGALHELAWAHQTGRQWYYLGYRVQDCDAMNYKQRFKPHQLLGSDGRWYDVSKAME